MIEGFVTEHVFFVVVFFFRHSHPEQREGLVDAACLLAAEALRCEGVVEPGHPEAGHTRRQSRPAVSAHVRTHFCKKYTRGSSLIRRIQCEWKYFCIFFSCNAAVCRFLLRRVPLCLKKRDLV